MVTPTTVIPQQRQQLLEFAAGCILTPTPGQHGRKCETHSDKHAISLHRLPDRHAVISPIFHACCCWKKIKAQRAHFWQSKKQFYIHTQQTTGVQLRFAAFLLLFTSCGIICCQYQLIRETIYVYSQRRLSLLFWLIRSIKELANIQNTSAQIRNRQLTSLYYIFQYSTFRNIFKFYMCK